MPENLNPEALGAASNSVRRITLGEVDSWDVASAAVSAYFAALPSPRPGTLIKTAEELESAAAETVIKDANGFVFEQDNLDPRLKARWAATGSKYPIMTECIELPALVLWVPTEGGRQ